MSFPSVSFRTAAESRALFSWPLLPPSPEPSMSAHHRPPIDPLLCAVILGGEGRLHPTLFCPIDPKPMPSFTSMT
ncbi:hypothetical protein BDA96_03G433300 [Sorghum bicolor]|uniref:Uncharacterized protein n=2 Tax=Sorghum bicolor TaxID=4558 RepID=A0A921RKH2_SORBI|nr:hypothetical protein BDA96_03G433300 [Sorghum bicolor]KXG33980.1 hypothetical protein SORBI_3003G401700 [Sorghum bicolor]